MDYRIRVLVPKNHRYSEITLIPKISKQDWQFSLFSLFLSLVIRVRPSRKSAATIKNLPAVAATVRELLTTGARTAEHRRTRAPRKNFKTQITWPGESLWRRCTLKVCPPAARTSVSDDANAAASPVPVIPPGCRSVRLKCSRQGKKKHWDFFL